MKQSWDNGVKEGAGRVREQRETQPTQPDGGRLLHSLSIDKYFNQQ